MLHDLLLAVLIVLVSLLYVKFAKLTKAINGLYEDFEFTLDSINKKLEEILSDIANSTSKIQDRICGVHEKLDKFNNGLENFNANILDDLNDIKLNTRDIVSTAMKDAAAHRQDIYNAVATLKDKLDAHNNYVIAHNKETRPLLSKLLEAIISSKTSESKDTPAENTNEVKQPKTAIRRNKRKYTKDTEEVKE